MTDSATETETNSAALASATNAANKRLREAPQDEWNGYKSEEAKERGVEWSPRKSPKDKAREDLRRLLAENPDLLDEITEDDEDEAPAGDQSLDTIG